MNIECVFLITDILLFFLFFVCMGYGLYCVRFEHLRAPWRQVAHNRLAMVAAVVLFGYFLVGLSDSMHFRNRALDKEGNALTDKQGIAVYDPHVYSLLDVFLESLRKNSEQSYSAPLAIQTLTKENVILPNGKQERQYARLRFGGKHLTFADSHPVDVFKKAITGGGLFAFIGVLLIILLMKGIQQQRKTVLFLLLFAGSILFVGGAAFYLSGYYHLFGTDKIGQDVFYRALKGIRTGIIIGTLTTLIMLPFAVMLGITAGYFKGWVDDLIQYIYTTLSSIPGVLLIASAVLMLQVYMDTHADQFESVMVRGDLQLFFLCIILGITSWTGLCRILRGETLKLREMEYVQAAVALGVNHFTILLRHILPNVMHIVLIAVVLDFSGLVLAEAILSYVGVGVDPSMESWGNMINAARLELARDPVVWWNLLAAFVLMFGLVLSANLFADGVRDAFDPRMRKR